MSKPVKLSFIFLIFAFFILIGCASKDFKEPGKLNTKRHRTSMSYNANFAQTWNAVMKTVSKYPVISSSKESGLIVTDWIKGKSDYLYSGFDENRIPYTIRYKFMIKIRPDGKGAKVMVKNKEQYFVDSVTAGIDFSGSVYQWLDCESSTLKESNLLRQVQENLSPGKR